MTQRTSAECAKVCVADLVSNTSQSFTVLSHELYNVDIDVCKICVLILLVPRTVEYVDLDVCVCVCVCV